MNQTDKHRVVVIGGGFAGLNCVRGLKAKNLDITLIDRRNFHLFQPLLYQVATGGLSPGDIASPIRAVFKKRPDVRVIHAEVTAIDPKSKEVTIDHDNRLPYDFLVIATGVKHHYFGKPEWSVRAPGLKTIEDALEMRRRLLSAFERAEREHDPVKRQALLRFVIVGAGPTGVELAGALAELSRVSMRREFRRFHSHQAEIMLVEGAARVLPMYPPKLSAKAAQALEKLGVTISCGGRVTDIEPGRVTLTLNGNDQVVEAETVLWAAGVKATRLGGMLHQSTGAPIDSVGRMKVRPDLSLPNHPEILVAGDLAHLADQQGHPLPGVAPVAMQQGRYSARLILAHCNGKTIKPFRYRDKGSLAVIGRNAAVADLPMFRFSGFFAWVTWAAVHIHFLIEFDSKLLVSFQWFWNYLTCKRGARLITEPSGHNGEKL